MRIIEAVWEKRNLGVITKEIEFEETDHLEEVKKCLENSHAEYLVAKVPTNRADITHLLGKNQYEYIEDMILFISNLEEVKYSKIMQRLNEAVWVKKADKEDIEEILTEIRKGMFSTDRISLDNHFSKKIAAERYVNWTIDELERGTEVYNYVYKDKNIGFFGLKEIKNGIYTSFLGGMFELYRNRGISSVVKAPEVVKKLGGKHLLSYVSSNNIAQVRTLICNGYNVLKIRHIFVKHKK